MLHDTLKLYYLNPHLLHQLPQALLYTLGVQPLNARHLIRVMEELTAAGPAPPPGWTAWLKKLEDDTWVARWLLCVFRSAKSAAFLERRLGKGLSVAEAMKCLKGLPVVPLESGERVRVTGTRPVFFPPPVGRSAYAFEKLMSVVKREGFLQGPGPLREVSLPRSLAPPPTPLL